MARGVTCSHQVRNHHGDSLCSRRRLPHPPAATAPIHLRALAAGAGGIHRPRRRADRRRASRRTPRPMSSDVERRSSPVTQEASRHRWCRCISRGDRSYSRTWRRLTVAALAAVPLFVAVGIARLLVVALPDAVGSPRPLLRPRVSINCCSARWRCSSPRSAPRPQHSHPPLPRRRWRRRRHSVRLSARSSFYTLSDSAPGRSSASTIHRARSRSCPRSDRALSWRWGLRPLRRPAGSASSPASRCSCSPRRQACSRCMRSRVTPASSRTCARYAAGPSPAPRRFLLRSSPVSGRLAEILAVSAASTAITLVMAAAVLRAPSERRSGWRWSDVTTIRSR